MREGLAEAIEDLQNIDKFLAVCEEEGLGLVSWY
jgi:hypothetical protein